MKEFESSYWTRMTPRGFQRRQLLRGTLVSGAGIAALGLFGCGGGSKSGGTAGDKSSLVTHPVDTTKKAKRGGVMKDRAFADPPTLDILTRNAPLVSYTHEVYSGLVQFIPGYLKPSEDEIGPDLAESFEYSPDGLQIALKLRQGVKWHNKPPLNGRALDMDDVLFAWNRFATRSADRVTVVNAVNPDGPVLSLTATDSRTVVIKLKEPVVYALGLFNPGGASGVLMSPRRRIPLSMPAAIRSAPVPG